jgi:hypothetical protein
LALLANDSEAAETDARGGKFQFPSWIQLDGQQKSLLYSHFTLVKAAMAAKVDRGGARKSLMMTFREHFEEAKSNNERK